MAWPTGTITLAAARKIFSDVTFQAVEVNGEVAFYKATHSRLDRTLENKSLTALCEVLWGILSKPIRSVSADH